MRIVWIGVVWSPRKGGMGASYAPKLCVLLELLLMVQKSQTTTWDVQNPVNSGINCLSTGAGFLPSTVLVYIPATIQEETLASSGTFLYLL